MIYCVDQITSYMYYRIFALLSAYSLISSYCFAVINTRYIRRISRISAYMNFDLGLKQIACMRALEHVAYLLRSDGLCLRPSLPLPLDLSSYCELFRHDGDVLAELSRVQQAINWPCRFV